MKPYTVGRAELLCWINRTLGINLRWIEQVLASLEILIWKIMAFEGF